MAFYCDHVFYGDRYAQEWPMSVGLTRGQGAIRSFSLTHFDGAGIKIAGDVPFMPVKLCLYPQTCCAQD